MNVFVDLKHKNIVKSTNSTVFVDLTCLYLLYLYDVDENTN